MQHLDEKIIEQLLKLMYTDNASFTNYPFSFLKAITLNPSLEFKTMDALMFILKNKDIYSIKKYISLEEVQELDGFPPLVLYEKY
jgi:hypothetical protein